MSGASESANGSARARESENERLSARTQVKQCVREGQRVGEPKRRVNMRQYLVWRTHSIGKGTFVFAMVRRTEIKSKMTGFKIIFRDHVEVSQIPIAPKQASC